MLNSTKDNIDDEKSFGRTRNLLDPAQIDEMERKKKAALQHKKEIDAQIAEKRRIQQLEEEIQQLNSIKIENEAKQIATTNQLNQELKKQQPQYQNLDNVLNLNTNNGPLLSSSRKPDTMATILQGDSTRIEDHDNTLTSRNTETRAQEIFRKMQEAELAAAEEKHKKLLKRLQRGGHDTRQLEKKFSELKARLSGNPNVVLNNNHHNNFNSNNGFDSVRQNNTHSSMSQVSEQEHYLEKQKQLLEKKIREKLPPPSSYNENNDSNSLNKENFDLNNEQKSKIKQIFQLLREDTQGLPAELSEEHLKLLLKQVQNKSNSQPNGNNNRQSKNIKTINNNNRAKSNEQKKREQQQQQQQTPPKMTDGKKPIWNYKNLQGKKAMPNSMKDPHYSERAKLIEERRKRHTEHFQGLVEKNSQKYNDFVQDHMSNHNNDYDDNDDFGMSNNKNRNNSISSMSSASDRMIEQKQVGPNANGLNKGQESILNLLTKNLASNTIYEEDEDLYNSRQKKKSNKILSNLDDGDNSNFGFVPFMRTNEFLDPVHAASPVPPSRESSAVKREREKARQV
jgi:hypothetical protein